MATNFRGGKRQREADRERRKKDKAERLRRNRLARAQEPDADMAAAPESLPPVALEDVVSTVPSQSRRQSIGPLRLFVGGLHGTTTVEALRAAFGRFGPIEDAIVIHDRMTGRSRGFGFVTFADSAAAAAAMAEMNGRELDGRILKVNNAEGR